MDKNVKEKLDLLFKIQEIDSKLDRIDRLKGEIPEELKDAEDTLIGLQARIDRINTEIEEMSAKMTDHKNDVVHADQLSRKYLEQQKTIRNSREFDALNKEIELQKLEIKLLDKKISTINNSIKEKKEEIKETNDLIKKQKNEISNKKAELSSIIQENLEKEKKYINQREQTAKNIEERLLNSYDKLRKNLRNKLAVVQVRRNACGGCFNVVPPQRQVDIKAQTKIIVCEHCGRIFSNVSEEEYDKEQPIAQI